MSADSTTPSRSLSNPVGNKVREGACEKNGSKSGRLRGAFFVHVPYPAVENEYGPLADALAEVVAYLVKGSTQARAPSLV